MLAPDVYMLCRPFVFLGMSGIVSHAVDDEFVVEVDE